MCYYIYRHLENKEISEQKLRKNNPNVSQTSKNHKNLNIQVNTKKIV